MTAGDAAYWEARCEALERRTLDEPQRRMVLLALHVLRCRVPGYAYGIGVITEKLGGQLDWPEMSIDPLGLGWPAAVPAEEAPPVEGKEGMPLI